MICIKLFALLSDSFSLLHFCLSPTLLFLSCAPVFYQASFVQARNAWLRAWERTIDDDLDDADAGGDTFDLLAGSGTGGVGRAISGGAPLHDRYALDERIGHASSELLDAGAAAAQHAATRAALRASDAPVFDQTLASDSVFVLAEVQADVAMLKLASAAQSTSSAHAHGASAGATDGAAAVEASPPPPTEAASGDSVPAVTNDELATLSRPTSAAAAAPSAATTTGTESSSAASAATAVATANGGDGEVRVSGGGDDNASLLPPWTPQLRSSSLLDYTTGAPPNAGTPQAPEVRPFSALFAAAAAGTAPADGKTSTASAYTRDRSSAWLAAIGGSVVADAAPNTAYGHAALLSYAQIMSPSVSASAASKANTSPHAVAFTPPPGARGSATSTATAALAAAPSTSASALYASPPGGGGGGGGNLAGLGAGSADAMDAFLRDFARGASVLS